MNFRHPLKKWAVEVFKTPISQLLAVQSACNNSSSKVTCPISWPVGSNEQMNKSTSQQVNKSHLGTTYINCKSKST